MNELLNYISILENIQKIVKLLEELSESNLLGKILETRKECVKIISQYDIIKLIIQVKNNELIDEQNKEVIQEVIQEDLLKDQMSDLSNLLGGNQEIDVNNFDPGVFDTFGKGISSLFSIKPENTIQIKNENNNILTDNNLTFQIKKKV